MTQEVLVLREETLLFAYGLPLALVALLLVPVFGWWIHSRQRRKRRQFAAALGPRASSLSPPPEQSQLRRMSWLRGLVLAAIVVAVAQPRWGQGQGADQASRLDLVLCLDVSRSMLAEDVSPDRLEAAREAIRRLADRARGERLGLVAFAGDARLCIPLTSDAETFVELLDGIDDLSIEPGGTDLAVALETALGALVGRAGGQQTIFLLTDGGDPSSAALRAAARCRAQGIRVHVAGFGSERGSKIPLQTAEGRSYLRDRSGEEVITVLDPAALQAISKVADGEYVVGRGLDELAEVYDRRVVSEVSLAGNGGRDSLGNRFQWPLLIAVLGLLFELTWVGRPARP